MNERSYWLEQGFTDEQTTKILNDLHAKDKAIKDLTSNVEIQKQENASIKTKIEEFEKATLNEQEKLELLRKETEKSLANAKMIENKAKAKEILAGAGISGEELENIVASVTSENEENTIKNANVIVSLHRNTITKTEQTVKEQLAALNPKPSPNGKDGEEKEITREEYAKMSYAQQLDFKRNNPEKYEKIK